MRGTVLTLAAAAALGVLVATQAPSAGPLQTTEGAAPGSSWLYPALGEERAVTDPIAQPPAGRPPAAADP